MTHRIRIPRREAGVGIVTAIFLLVVMAGLGVAMVALYTTQQASSNLDLQGARAYQAARAGLEWGLFQRLRNNQCTAAAPVAMPAGTSLSGFAVTVRCSGTQASSDGTTGATTPAQFTITATACNLPDAGGACPVSVNPGQAPPGPEYVSRTVEAQL